MHINAHGSLLYRSRRSFKTQQYIFHVDLTKFLVDLATRPRARHNKSWNFNSSFFFSKLLPSPNTPRIPIEQQILRTLRGQAALDPTQKIFILTFIHFFQPPKISRMSHRPSQRSKRTPVPSFVTVQSFNGFLLSTSLAISYMVSTS